LPTAALLLAIAVAILLRAPNLDRRPLHNDESVNATKLARLWQQHEYKYDPHEYHGPTLHYFSLPVLWLGPAKSSEQLGDGELRVLTVLFGIGLIALLPLLRDAIGPGGGVWSALFLAVSPAMVFYSRYFIHEMLLVFFTLATLAAGWRYVETRKTSWAAATGAGMGLMAATKETFILTFAAFVFALLATRIWNRWRAQRSAAPSAAIAKIKWTLPVRHLAAAAGGAILIWLVLFSSFLTNPAGLLDSFRTYLPWFHRAGGASPHLHPWYFYFLHLLWFHPANSPVWTELAVLALALVGVIAGFCGNCLCVVRPGFVRFLTFFTVALAVIYSAISYKTPWCALNFWLGFILLAGVGAAALVSAFRDRLTQRLIACLLAVGTLHLGLQAWLLNQQFPADLRNPYVYAQTSPHARELVDRVRAIGHMAPDGFNTTVKVISPESYWPLPWSLREFKNIGWYDAVPADPYAPIVIVSGSLDARLDEKSDKKWLMTGYYELRPNVFLELYVEFGLWEKFVATLPRDPE